MKKRIIGLDILRDFSVIFIIGYHFCAEYIITAEGQNISIRYVNLFLNIPARPASLLLFLISGFALIYHHEDLLSLKDFYLRRFRGLFLPFYIAWTLMAGICFCVDRWPFHTGIPFSRLLYTFFGMDALAEMIEPDFYRVGEWFMASIVVCYLLFPLLSFLLKKFRYLTLLSLLIWMLLLLFLYNPFPEEISTLQNPLFVVGYFYIGMLLGEKFSAKRIPSPLRRFCFLVSALIWAYWLIFQFFPGLLLCIPSDEIGEVVNGVWSLALFLAFKDAEIPQKQVSYRVLTYLSGISWYLILVHHRIIILFCQHYQSFVWVESLPFGLLLAAAAVISAVWFFSELVRAVSVRLKRILSPPAKQAGRG